MATAKKATKATEVKEVKEVKAEVVAEVKEAAKKEPAKKAPAKKAPAKKAATTKKAAPAKKEAAKVTTTVQYQGNEISVATIEENVKAAFVADGHKASEIKTLNIYVKPEEFAAYYVINDEITGRVYLF